MHAGRLVPIGPRPDFTAAVLPFNYYPPRKMQMRVTSGDGSLVTPQINDVLLSGVQQEAVDGQSIFYLLPTPDVPDGEWEIRLIWFYQPDTINPTANGTRTRWTFRVSGVEIATQITITTAETKEWWAPFPTTFYPNASASSWTRSVPTAQFGNCSLVFGSAGWAVQPEYKPYVTRP
jgi:hypothetical protein